MLCGLNLFAIHGWSNTTQPTLGKRIEQNCRPSALQSQHLKMKRLMTTTSAWTYASARSHPHRIILVITSILRAAHRFLWNCTCCALLVQGKYSCACPHKTTPYSKCEWICRIRDKHCCAKKMNTHKMKGKNDCLLFAIITSSRPCLWGSEGSQKKGFSFLGFLS